jgi:hypothetical protein
MVIPIAMLWNTRIPGRKKLAFMGLFSLSIITMVIAIVRAVNVNSSRDGNGQDDATFLWLWTAIQASLGMSAKIFSIRSHEYNSLIVDTTDISFSPTQPSSLRACPLSLSYSTRQLLRRSPSGHRRTRTTSD